MTKQKLVYLIIIGLNLPLTAFTQSNCSRCSVSLPILPKDTIFLGQAPDGIAGNLYDGSISFRLPKTTTPVNAIDPGTPGGLPISKITILTVANLPPGLTWTASQTSFNPGNMTDGCVKLCGSPLQPGLYEVQVFVTAEVLLFTQSTSFSFPIYIGPAVSQNAGFSMVNSSGCGAVTVDFQNNIKSKGKNGYQYFWNFGNGKTSTLENPGPQTYNQAGIYLINYQAAVDTIGYLLTSIQIQEAGCKDLNLPPIFNGAPDLYIKLRDPNGNLILQTNPVKNTPIPYSITLNLPIMPGNYSLEVRDNETIGSKGCGSVNFSRATAGILANGDLKIKLSIINPVSTIQSTDTVVVYPTPSKPSISPSGRLNLCKGQEIKVSSDYQQNVQWFRNASPLIDSTKSVLTLGQNGDYFVEHTSLDGCKAQSDMLNLIFQELPVRPAFYNNNNKIAILEPSSLPVNYRLQWYLNEILVSGATDTVFCNKTPGTSLFGVQVTDVNTGCQNEFTLGFNFNPDFNCGKPWEEGTLTDTEVKISPNPSNGIVDLKLSLSGLLNFDLRLIDVTGRTILESRNQEARQFYHATLDLTFFPRGVYLLQIISGKNRRTERLMKL